MGFGGRTNGNYQITPKLLTLQQICLMSKVVGDVISDNFCLKNSPKKSPKGGVKKI